MPLLHVEQSFFLSDHIAERAAASTAATVFFARGSLMENMCRVVDRHPCQPHTSHVEPAPSVFIPSSRSPTQLSGQNTQTQPQQSYPRAPCAPVRHLGRNTISAKRCSTPNDRPQSLEHFLPTSLLRAISVRTAKVVCRCDIIDVASPAQRSAAVDGHWASKQSKWPDGCARCVSCGCVRGSASSILFRHACAK